MAISNSNTKRPIVEEGVVLQKYISKGRKAGEYNGVAYEAKDPTPTVRVASSYLINEDGMADFVVLDYEVSEDMYKKLRYLSKVKVMYVLSSTIRDGKSQDVFSDKQIVNILPNS